MPFHPKSFKKNDHVISVYSGNVYVVIEPDKKGMAKLKNESGWIEDWNSCNNEQFELIFPGTQLKLF